MRMNNLLKITGYTIRDQMRNRSFYVLLGISIFFVMMIRGCYKGNYTVNNQQVDSVTIAWHASKIAFHIIAGGMFLMVCLLGMRIFSRDRDDGSIVLFLTRPAARWEYLFGRVLGTGILCSAFMFILHMTIFFIAWIKTGGVIPGYLLASLVCCINILFATALVCLCSLYMPDFIAALTVLGIIGAGFISDGLYLVTQNKMIQQALPEGSTGEPSLWRVLYPKVYLLQDYAVSIIDTSEFIGMGPVHPAINVLAYISVIVAALYFSFRRKEL